MPIYFPRGWQGDIPSTQTQGELLKNQTQTSYVHRSVPKNPDRRGKQDKQAPIPFPGAIPAIVNTAIPACNGTTPGYGTVDIYYVDGINTNTAATADDNQANMDCLNWLTNTNTINSGKHVWVVQCGQFYGIVSGDC